MNRIIKLTAILLCLVLLLCLTGCERADYVKAVEIYNAGDFAQARTMFLELGEFENSQELLKRCDYHLAVAIYKEGKFQEAIDALEKLGDYEDCQELITHSRYQLALALVESRDFDAAEAALKAMNGYENSDAHIAKLRWDRFFDYLVKNGEAQEDGHTYILRPQEDETCLIADTQSPDQLQLYTQQETDKGFRLVDTLTLTLTRGQDAATFTAVSKFIFPWDGKESGSTQTAMGNISLAQFGKDAALTPLTYVKDSVDIYGKESQTTDPAESSMAEGMAATYAKLTADIPALVKSTGVDYTLAELGLTGLT